MPGRTWIALLVAVALAGCGGEEPALSERSAEALHAQVANVREAAAEGDRAAALKALDVLADRVRDLQDEEALAAADAAALERGIARARRRVRTEIAEPTATATATATATPTPTPTPTATATAAPPKAKPPKAKPGKGNGKPKGKKGK